MECKVVEERMTEYCLGYLDGEVLATFEEHLSGCQECLRDFFVTKHAFDAASRSSETPAAEVRASLRQLFIGERPRRQLLLAVCALAAAIALVVFGYGRLSSTSRIATSNEEHTGYPIDSANESALNLNKL